MSDEKLVLAFSNLRSGWCDIDILLGGYVQFGGTFSYTPNDGLADFIRCVSAIASPYPHAEASCLWSKEPGAFRISLQINNLTSYCRYIRWRNMILPYTKIQIR